MKSALTICVFLFLSVVIAKADVNYFPPLQPIVPSNPVQTYNTNSVTTLTDPFVTPNTNYTYTNQPQNIYPNISNAALARLENRVFNQNYANYNPENRIERLEQKLFGATQSGDLTTRYQTLLMAARNYKQVNPYVPNQIVQTGWRGILGGLGNSMMGSMTGFTPPINPCYDNFNNPNTGFNNYNQFNNYANPGGMYRGYRSNQGYYDSLRNYGSGAGVTILN